MNEKRSELSNGRVEMNLCEVPIVVPGRPTIDRGSHVIEDVAWVDGKEVRKQLKISPASDLGFPTRFDAGVLRAVITIAHRQNGFNENKVFVTRYQIAKMLGIPNDGRNSKIISKSLKKLSHVRYSFENTWWKNDKKEHSHESFGFLDWVHMSGDKNSFIVIGAKLLDSLQSGYVREIDFNVMNKFKTHVADQSYLLLKKRFYRRSKIEFNLKRYFQFHLGMTSGYHASQMKQKLEKGIKELEDSGLIEPVPYKDRFEKKGSEWFVKFTKAKKKVAAKKNGIVFEMTSRGLTEKTALEFEKEFPIERIRSKIAILDWKLKRPEESPRNPGGWLSKAIRDDYAAPKGFTDHEVVKKKKKARDDRSEKEESKRREDSRKESESIQLRLDLLPDDDRRAHVMAAIEAMPSSKFRMRAFEEMKNGKPGTFVEMAIGQFEGEYSCQK